MLPGCFYIKVCRFLRKICAVGREAFGYAVSLMVSPRYTVQVTTVEPALELVRKYNIPGPRYTSYPTAPQFSADVDRAALLAEIAADNRDPVQPLLAVHRDERLPEHQYLS